MNVFTFSTDLEGGDYDYCSVIIFRCACPNLGIHTGQNVPLLSAEAKQVNTTMSKRNNGVSMQSEEPLLKCGLAQLHAISNG